MRAADGSVIYVDVFLSCWGATVTLNACMSGHAYPLLFLGGRRTRLPARWLRVRPRTGEHPGDSDCGGPQSWRGRGGRRGGRGSGTSHQLPHGGAVRYGTRVGGVNAPTPIDNFVCLLCRAQNFLSCAILFRVGLFLVCWWAGMMLPVERARCDWSRFG